MPQIAYCQTILPADEPARIWCPWPDSNGHIFRQTILSRSRLPFRHRGPACESALSRGRFAVQALCVRTARQPPHGRGAAGLQPRRRPVRPFRTTARCARSDRTTKGQRGCCGTRHHFCPKAGQRLRGQARGWRPGLRRPAGSPRWPDQTGSRPMALQEQQPGQRLNACRQAPGRKSRLRARKQPSFWSGSLPW